MDIWLALGDGVLHLPRCAIWLPLVSSHTGIGTDVASFQYVKSQMHGGVEAKGHLMKILYLIRMMFSRQL